MFGAWSRGPWQYEVPVYHLLNYDDVQQIRRSKSTLHDVIHQQASPTKKTVQAYC